MTRRLPLAALAVSACAAVTTWDTAEWLRPAEPIWFVEDYACEDGWGLLTLPLGDPLLVRVFGFDDTDLWWVYDAPPEYEPGTDMLIPCEEGQTGGRVTYVHE